MSQVSTPPLARAFSCLLTVVAAVLLLTAQASADSERERARQHVVEGDALKVEAEKAKAEGDTEAAARLFEESAEEYQAAYDLVPHPLMLYNLAQVYRLAGEAERSLMLYEEFLSLSPTGEAADFARKYVKILERTIAKASERKTGPGDDDGDLGDDDDDDLGDDDDDDLGDDDDDDFGDDDDDDDFDDDDDDDDGKPGKGAASGGNDSMRYGGLGVAAAGLASIAIGVKFGLDARDISNYLTSYPFEMWTDEDLLLQEEGKAAEQKMFIFTGVGAALIVGGGVLYYLGGQKERASAGDTSALRLTPSIDAHSAGWSLAGRF